MKNEFEHEKERLLKGLKFCDRVLMSNLSEPKDEILKEIQNEIKNEKGCNISIYCALAEPYLKSRSLFTKTNKSKDIVLYSNKLNSKYEIKEALIHEMIHGAHDCVHKINWKNEEDLVCSEIKASFNAECSKYSFESEYNLKKECVSKISKKSLILQPNLKEDKIDVLLNRMMKKCFNKNIWSN
eukprot:gene312-6726_t